MEDIQENNNKKSNNQSINDQTSENIPHIDLDESPFQLITKDPEKKEDQNKNDKSTEENSNSIISIKNPKKINNINYTDNKSKKSSVDLNIEVIKEEKPKGSKNKKNKKKV